MRLLLDSMRHWILVVGAVGWLKEREKPTLGVGVLAGAFTILAQRQFTIVEDRGEETPWRALGPSPCGVISLTILWIIAITAHIGMLAFSVRSLIKFCSSSRTCVAAAQLSVSISTLAAAHFMLQMDLRYDSALSPPRQSDANTCTGVSMVQLTSVAVNNGNSGEEGSPFTKGREQPPT